MTTTYEVTFAGTKHYVGSEYTDAAVALEMVESLRGTGILADQITVAKVTREPIGLVDLRAEVESAERNPATCGWYLMCMNDADGVVEHPILGPVPTCRRCADKHDLDLIEAEVNVVKAP